MLQDDLPRLQVQDAVHACACAGPRCGTGIRALSTDELAGASGIANNVVIDGSYITQPYIYFNGTVCGRSFQLLRQYS